MLKLIADELGFGKAARAEKPMASHIPYLRHVSDTVIALDNGSLCTILKLDGLFFQTEDQAELNMRSHVQNMMIRALASSRYSLWSTVIRREVSPEIGGRFTNDFCRELDRRYMAQLGAKRMFVNELYFTIVRSAMRGPLGFVDKLSGKMKSTGSNLPDREMVKELEEAAHNVLNDFQKYGAKNLGIVHRDGEPYSEPCEFIQKILSGGQSREMRLPRMAIKSYAGSKRLHFGKRALQVQGATSAEDRFGAVLAIKEYPPFSGPGMLDGLLQVNHEFILTQSFTLVDKPIAQERISRLQRQIAASDEAGSVVETDIDFALNSLVNQEAVFGNHHLTLLVLTRRQDLLDKAIAELGSKLTDMNINWLREDMCMEAGFWAQLPGNHAYIARNSLMSSANFSGFSSLHNFAHGQTTNLHWKTPICVLETTSQTPYYFNFHRRDIGHFLVTGPTGSGKTVFMASLLAQAFRVDPEPKAVFFDKDRGAEIFIRAVGGSYEILEPGTLTGFNPLQVENSATNRDFLVRLLKAMLRKDASASYSQIDEDTLASAIFRLMKEPSEHRTLANLAPLLMGQSRADENDLYARLRPWIEDGDKAWLFNAGKDTLSFSGRRIFGFDMTSVLDNPDIRTPLLMYLSPA
jgi:type IV secretion system protein VirB4